MVEDASKLKALGNKLSNGNLEKWVAGFVYLVAIMDRQKLLGPGMGYRQHYGHGFLHQDAGGCLEDLQTSRYSIPIRVLNLPAMISRESLKRRLSVSAWTAGAGLMTISSRNASLRSVKQEEVYLHQYLRGL